ncbi:predicted protein [Histoplasma capsulatum H143]|uniref:Uncharacterized protein n=1 Tax=Ajellomyces capsulatus (strain H143) TaxID=544712 RepID=C6H8W6_AJECH|nr:predicted protein [Histoplasma capsulatum H143]
MASAEFYASGIEFPPQLLNEDTMGQVDLPALRMNQKLLKSLNIDISEWQNTINDNQLLIQVFDIHNLIIHCENNITAESESEVSSLSSMALQESVLGSPLFVPSKLLHSIINCGTAVTTPPASSQQERPFTEGFDSMQWGGDGSSWQNLNGCQESVVSSQVPSNRVTDEGSMLDDNASGGLSGVSILDNINHNSMDVSLLESILVLSSDAEIGSVTLENLMSVVDVLLMNVIFEFFWGTFDCGEIIEFLKALESQQWITGGLVNYFAAKLSRQGDYGQGSCSHCWNVISGSENTEWKFYHADCEQQNDMNDSGVFMLWFLHACADGGDAAELSDNYCITLVWVIMDDLRSHLTNV